MTHKYITIDCNIQNNRGKSLNKKVFLYKIVRDCVNRESCKRMYLQFTGDVAAVCDDCVDGYEQLGCNLFVGHSLYKAYDDFLLAL